MTNPTKTIKDDITEHISENKVVIDCAQLDIEGLPLILYKGYSIEDYSDFMGALSLVAKYTVTANINGSIYYTDGSWSSVKSNKVGRRRGDYYHHYNYHPVPPSKEDLGTYKENNESMTTTLRNMLEGKGLLVDSIDYRAQMLSIAHEEYDIETNALEELNTFLRTVSTPIKCANIFVEYTEDIGGFEELHQVQLYLPVNYSPEYLASFLKTLSYITYDSEQRSQHLDELKGYIWFIDGSWAERGTLNIRGSYITCGWLHKQHPSIPQILQT